jgi:hypothetical protein
MLLRVLILLVDIRIVRILFFVNPVNSRLMLLLVLVLILDISFVFILLLAVSVNICLVLLGTFGNSVDTELYSECKRTQAVVKLVKERLLGTYEDSGLCTLQRDTILFSVGHVFNTRNVVYGQRSEIYQIG